MLEYNTSRNQLIIKEYGRNVQKMIEAALRIQDYEKRTEAAKAIIKVMAQLNPNDNSKQERESIDYWQKLWDHLFIISDYQLDVDSPFPKPQPSDIQIVIEPHKYQKTRIHNRTYGRNMENIIKKIAMYPDGQEKQKLTKTVANHLKKLYLTWNRDSVDDSLILQQIQEMSDGKLTVPEDFQLDSTKNIIAKHNIYQKNPPKNNNTSNKRHKKKKKKDK